jgi:hypothetical protein
MKLRAKDSDDWRYERLLKAVSFAKGRLRTMELGIGALEDHEGNLVVYWERRPTARERRAMGWAWEMAGELQENVEHRAYETPLLNCL